jgi:hypothetical protein
LFRRNESTLFRYLCAQVKRQPIINGKPDENAVKYDDCYLLLSVGLCVKMRTGICMRDGKTGTRSVQGRRGHNLVTNSPRPPQTHHKPHKLKNRAKIPVVVRGGGCGSKSVGFAGPGAEIIAST